ncbi:hypothetical protein E4U54_000755 [Claviceps lovelessii]|nr:hypothetical protein E4U54_000755 [Claviceps lovelessii]
MSLSSAVSGIFTSIYDLFASILAAILALAQGALHGVQSTLMGIVHLARDVVSQMVHLTGGATKLVASNFIALAVGGLLVFAYLRYAAGNRPAVPAQKKTQ